MINFARIERKIKDTSIRNKLLLSYVLLIFIPLILLFLISWFKISQGLRDNMYNLALKSVEQSASYLEYKLEYITSMSDIIMLRDDLQEVMSRRLEEYRKDFFQQSLDADNLNDFFKTFENYNDIFKVKLYVPDGLTYSEGNPYFLNIKTASENDWFRNALSSGHKYEWFPSSYFNDSISAEGPAISLLRRVIDQNNYNKTNGMLRIEILEKILQDILKKANAAERGLTYLLNSRGEILTSYGSPHLINEVTEPKILEETTRSEKKWSSIIIKDEKYITTFSGISRTDWKLVTVIPYSEVLKAGSEVRDFMLVIMAITAVIAYITAIYFVRLSVHRIRLLGSNMHRVRNGDFNIEVPVKSHDELGQLTTDFNYMVKEMAVMIEERFSTGKKMKSLELKALQAQINPHFLYNSLDMINWTAAVNGISEIETMVQSLAKFYKISLSKGAETISIKDEIEHVKAYITIQNLRYDNGINLILDIDEGIYEYNIIKIVLQPIVENAILHGILKKKSKKGTITISGRFHNEDIIISVTDDGVGTDTENLNALLNTQKESRSYGLRNINERIRLHYDQRYCLTFSSEKEKGTTVTLVIPAVH